MAKNGSKKTSEAVFNGPFECIHCHRSWTLDSPGAKKEIISNICPRCGWDQDEPLICPHCGQHRHKQPLYAEE